MCTDSTVLSVLIIPMENTEVIKGSPSADASEQLKTQLKSNNAKDGEMRTSRHSF